jgi:hypothetical protein
MFLMAALQVPILQSIIMQVVDDCSPGANTAVKEAKITVLRNTPFFP